MSMSTSNDMVVTPHYETVNGNPISRTAWKPDETFFAGPQHHDTFEGSTHAVAPFEASDSILYEEADAMSLSESCSSIDDGFASLADADRDSRMR